MLVKYWTCYFLVLCLLLPGIMLPYQMCSNSTNFKSTPTGRARWGWKVQILYLHSMLPHCKPISNFSYMLPTLLATLSCFNKCPPSFIRFCLQCALRADAMLVCLWLCVWGCNVKIAVSSSNGSLWLPSMLMAGKTSQRPIALFSTIKN